jgi:outer membrane protein TolC
MRRFKTVVVWLLVFRSAGLLAQQSPASAPSSFTLRQAVQFALAHYPQARAAAQKLIAAQAGVRLARTDYLPHADMMWQSNRGTYNNITGQLFPQSVLPSLSGTVLPDSSGRTAWNTGAGALLSWQPFDFGLRAANVNVAQAGEHAAEAQLEVTKLDVEANAANAFLEAAAAQQLTLSAKANVDRRETLAKSIHVLVDNQLRPGADASRADAELAAARTQFLRARQAEEEALIRFAEALGIAGQSIEIAAGALPSRAPNIPLSEPNVNTNPSAKFAFSEVEQSQAREHALDRSYVPQFRMQSGISGRGSGIKNTGQFLGGNTGLMPDRYNWALGVTATFSPFDIFSLRAHKQIEAATERSARAQYDQMIQQLTAQQQRARTSLETSIDIAKNAEIALSAAQQTDRQAEARYKSGLATLVELADAQQLLVKAESEEAVDRLNVWRALLATGFAAGDLTSFLDAAEKGASSTQ